MNVLSKVLTVGVCLLALTSRAEAATLTITVNGTNSGAVSSQPGGFVCNSASGSATCVYTFPAGTTIKLAADSPSTPGVFNNGAGDASACATSTCTFVIQNDSSITATFSAAGPAITIGLLGDGKGEVRLDNNRCQNFELGFSACTVYYAPGSQVTLTGINVGGGIFEGFSSPGGDAAGCGAASPCVFTLSTGATINASFARLTSVAVQPSTATIGVGQPFSFTDRGTFTNAGTRTLFGGSGSGGWRTWTSMHDARFGLAAGVLNDHMYAVGGVPNVCSTSPCPFGPLATVEMYNLDDPPVGGTFAPWTFKASMLVPRESPAAAVLGGKLYVLGGRTTGGIAVASVEAYDSVTNTWTPRASMSAPRAGLAAAVIGNTLYAMGGGLDSGDPTTLDTLEAYDVTTNSWTTLAHMPTPRSPAAVALNGLIYAIGGGTAGTAVEAYNPADNTWTTKAPLPSFREGLGAGVIDGLIYVIGGEAGPGTTQVYNPARNAWQTLAPMPTARRFFGIAVLDGRLFAAGGLVPPSTPLATFESVRPPEATWWSSTPAVASVDSNGFAHSTSTGTTTITARSVGIDCAATGGCATLTVANPVTPLTVSLPGQISATSGSPVTWCVSFFDSNPSGAPWSATVDYGDGSPQGVLTNIAAGGSCGGGGTPAGAFNLTHTFTANVTVTVTVTNAVGTFGTNHTTVQLNGGGGGDEACALVTLTLAPGSAVFTQVLTTVFDPSTGNPLDDPFMAPIGEGLDAPAGTFGLRFTPPAGYSVTPSETTFTLACGDNHSIALRFALPDAAPPTVTAAATPNVLWPANGRTVAVVVSGRMTDAGSGINASTAAFQLVDEYGVLHPSGHIAVAADGSYSFTVMLTASRLGSDADGRRYQVIVNVSDNAGNAGSASAIATVPHDQGK